MWFPLILSSFEELINITIDNFTVYFYRPARLKNIDRSTAQHLVVTVGDVTVIITDYQPKAESTASTSNAVSNYNNDSNMSFHESSDTESD